MDNEKKISTENKNEKEKLKKKLNEIENKTNSEIEKIKKAYELEKNKNKEEYNNLNLITEQIKNEKEEIIKLYEEKIKSNEEIINKLKTENEDSKKIHNKELEELNNKIKTITQKQNEVTNLKNKLENDKEVLESQHREEIDRNNFSHTLAINEMQIKLDSQISQLKIENFQLKENYDKLLTQSKVLFNSNDVSKCDDDINSHKFNETNKNFKNNETIKSNIIKYQNNINDNKFSSTGLTLIKRNSKKLAPMKSLNNNNNNNTNNNLKLSKIIINAKKK